MSHFEYISVAVSIVLSLGVIRLLDGIRHAFLSEGRYLVLSLWIVVKLLNHLLFWWALWTSREFPSWNIAIFTWILLFPGILYLQVSSLVTTAPQAVADWRTHFESVRRWFFLANILLVSHTMITPVILEIGAPIVALLAVQAVVLLANVVGLLTANPKAHLLIVVLVLAVNVLGFGSIFFDVGTAGAD